MKFTIFISICCIVFGCFSDGKNNNATGVLVPYRKGKLWGYSNDYGKIKIPCKFIKTCWFDSFGLGQVWIKNKNLEVLFGLIDQEGTFIVPPRFSVSNYKYFVIDYDGKDSSNFGPFEAFKHKNKLIVITDQSLEDISSLTKSKGYIQETNKGVKLIDRNGKNLLPSSFKYVNHHTHNGKICYLIAKDSVTKKMTIFSDGGSRMLQEEFDSIAPFSDNLFKGRTTGSKATSMAVFKLNGEFVYNESLDFRDPIGQYYRASNSYFSLGKKKLVSSGYPNSHYDFRFYSKFIIVPTKKNEIKTFSILDHNLEPIVNGQFKSIVYDSNFSFLLLFDRTEVIVSDLQGERKATFVNADTVIPISKSRFFVQTSSKGCGIWDLNKSKFIIPPTNQGINYTLRDKYLLKDSCGSWIVYSYEGKSLDTLNSVEVVYHSNLFDDYEGLTLISSKVPSGKGMYSTVFQTLLSEKKSKKVENNDVPEVMTTSKYINTSYYFIGKRNGNYILHGVDSKYTFKERDDATLISVLRFGDKTYAKWELKEKKRHTKFTSLDQDQISFDGFRGIYIIKGRMYIKVFDEMSTDQNNEFNRLYGLVSADGRFVLNKEYTNISLESEYSLIWVNAKKYSQIYNYEFRTMATFNSQQIINWYGHWGEVQGTNKNGKRGAVDINGKQIVPIKYDEIYPYGNFVGVGKSSETGTDFLGYYDLKGSPYFKN